jgi:hypothetical protein
MIIAVLSIRPENCRLVPAGARRTPPPAVIEFVYGAIVAGLES